MALIQLLAAATATAAGKVATAAAVVAVAGGGVAVAASAADSETDTEETVEQTDQPADDDLSIASTEVPSPEDVELQEGEELKGEELDEELQDEGEIEVEVADEDEVEAEEDRGRSSAVHEALAGDSEARPGDGSDFGQAVSKNARENPGTFGPSVAASARGDVEVEADETADLDDEDDKLETSSAGDSKRGNSAEAPGRQGRG